MVKHTYRHYVLGKDYHIFKSRKVYWAYRMLESEYVDSLNKTKPRVKREPVIVNHTTRIFCKEISSIFPNSCVSFPDHTLGKWINNEFIIKPSVQCRKKDGTTYTEWFETCNKELIDTRCYNLDGTYKY
jgi:hypothetical protein